MTSANISLKNDFTDTIHINLIKSLGLTVVIQAAIEADSKATDEHINAALFALADIIQEARDADIELGKIRRQEKLES